MGLMNRLAGALGYERRDLGNNIGPFGGWSGVGWPGMSSMTSAGYEITPFLAENLSTTTACINAIASTLASLPAYVYRTTDGGREMDPAHPVAKLIRRPNDWQTWGDWIELAMSQVLLYGNALSMIETDEAGQPTALIPVPWQNVSLQLNQSNRLVYTVIAYQAPFGGVGTPRRLLQDEVFHLKDRGDFPFLGRSRISRAPEVIGNAVALQEFSGAQWRNGVTPAGAIQMEGSMTPEQFGRLRDQFNSIYSGAHNARKVMILDNRATWQTLSVSPEDAEILASRRYSVEELSRLFGVPGPIIGDLSHGTFTNSETAGRWFAMFTLMPWARKIEAEFQRSVFTNATRHLEIDLSGLQRGSYAERWQANVAAVQAGILTANEVREQEGYNPRPDTAPAEPGIG
jgi:HK97 family phage portal protein